MRWMRWWEKNVVLYKTCPLSKTPHSISSYYEKNLQPRQSFSSYCEKKLSIYCVRMCRNIKIQIYTLEWERFLSQKHNSVWGIHFDEVKELWSSNSFPSTHSFQIVNGAVNRMHSYQRIKKKKKKKKKKRKKVEWIFFILSLSSGDDFWIDESCNLVQVTYLCKLPL